MTRYLGLAAIAATLALGLPLSLWARGQEPAQPPLRWTLSQHGSQPQMTLMVIINLKADAVIAFMGYSAPHA
jgi:hypothetical protein